MGLRNGVALYRRVIAISKVLGKKVVVTISCDTMPRDIQHKDIVGLGSRRYAGKGGLKPCQSGVLIEESDENHIAKERGSQRAECRRQCLGICHGVFQLEGFITIPIHPHDEHIQRRQCWRRWRRKWGDSRCRWAKRSVLGWRQEASWRRCRRRGAWA